MSAKNKKVVLRAADFYDQTRKRMNWKVLKIHLSRVCLEHYKKEPFDVYRISEKIFAAESMYNDLLTKIIKYYKSKIFLVITEKEINDN